MQRGGYHGSGGLIFGGIIVAVGIVLLLENLGILRVRDLWDFWPLILVAIGAGKILEHRNSSGLVWGGMLVLAGSALFLNNMDIFGVSFLEWRLIWPLLIVGFGASMLLRSHENTQFLKGEGMGVNPTISLNGIFSGGRRRFDSQDFHGGEINAIFGGFHIDLLRCKIAGERAVIDVNAVFGGVELFVPDNWRVTSKGTGVFGGFEDKTMPPRFVEGVVNPELIVTGAAVFGGITIRN